MSSVVLYTAQREMCSTASPFNTAVRPLPSCIVPLRPAKPSSLTPPATLRKLANPTIKFYQRGKWMSRKIMIEYSFTAVFRWDVEGGGIGVEGDESSGGDGMGAAGCGIGMWGEIQRLSQEGGRGKGVMKRDHGFRGGGGRWAAVHGRAAAELADETGSQVPGRRRAAGRRGDVSVFP